MKPIIKYRGGKSKELDMLLPHIPVYEGRYIEPFFGGGAMFFPDFINASPNFV
jgi:DNA adenine methylase